MGLRVPFALVPFGFNSPIKFIIYYIRYVQLEELKSLFLRKFLIFGIIYHL